MNSENQQPTCSNKILEPKNINVATTKDAELDKKYVFTEKGLKKRTHDSLSSSENSISSGCDDPSEIEADILKATQEQHEEEEEESTEPITTITTVATNRTASTSKEHPATNMSLDEKENITEDTVDVADMPAAILKITYKFTNTETKLLRKILSSHGLRESEENQNFSLLWTGVHIKPDILRNLTPYQRVNHFPR